MYIYFHVNTFTILQLIFDKLHSTDLKIEMHIQTQTPQTEKAQLGFDLCNRVIVQIEEIIFNQFFNLVERSFFLVYTGKMRLQKVPSSYC